MRINMRSWSGFLCMGLFLAGMFLPSEAVQACSGDELVDVTLPNGSRWDFCWTVRETEGVVLENVYFSTPDGTRRRVMTEAGLAQVHIRFDDGSSSFDALTDISGGGGFGVAGNITLLHPSDCMDGTVLASRGNPVVCQAVRERGYAYKSYSAVKQGDALVLESQSKVGLNTFVVRWRLFDDGGIEPSIGLTGLLPVVGSESRYGWELDQTGRVGVGFHTSYHWRLDFDIGTDENNDIVEQIEVIPSADRLTKTLAVTPVSSESSLVVNPELKRSWRVRDANQVNVDGHPISYHLEPLHAAHQFPSDPLVPWQQYDVFVTRHDPCQRYINANDTTGGCASDITGYVNGEAIEPGNVVLWYRVNYHHLPRGEDEPAVPVRWNGFTIVPRDWWATNPLAMLVAPHSALPA